MATIFVHPQALSRTPLDLYVKYAANLGFVLGNKKMLSGRVLLVLKPLTDGDIIWLAEHFHVR